jgi:hypothetical protein
VQGIGGLLVDGFNRDGKDVLVASGLEEGFGVGAVGLVALAVASHMSGWKQRDLVAEGLELTPPVMGRKKVRKRRRESRCCSWTRPGAWEMATWKTDCARSTATWVVFMRTPPPCLALGAVDVSPGTLVPVGGGVHPIRSRTGPQASLSLRTRAAVS